MADCVQLTPLDHHFADFITRLDSAPCDALWLAAALASAATGRGHVCLDLATAAEGEVQPFRPGPTPLRPPSAEQWRTALTACTTVGRPGDYTPLVLDDADRLYLHRSWDHERRVANGLLSRCTAVPVDDERLRAGLDRYFPPRTGATDWQRVAAMASVTRRFTVISGGPGTGKTATVARILALLIEQAGEREPVLTLAAPTGKAAMRLRHSILRAMEQAGLSHGIRPRFPDQVQTIHRLLGVMPGSTSFRHNRDNPLCCDVLVVDEVSMVDLPLMARLLEALPDQARIILLGDQDQLASVEAGAVLADICNRGLQSRFSTGFHTMAEKLCGPLPAEPAASADTSPPPPIADSIIHLRTSYRFGADSGIGLLSRLINAGEGAAALDLLQSATHGDLSWRPLPAAAGFDAAFTDAAREGYGAYARATTPESALEALERFRVLSPHRAGICGVANLNRLAEAALGLRRPEGQPWCRLLPLMVTGNNYELGLFNGDTAVLLDDPESGRLSAFFPDPEGGLRRLSPLRLPPTEPALALTVHKSQGSEFDRVLLILPEGMSETLSREMLYTAVTRARSRVEIWGSEEAFLRAAGRRIERSSGLRDRLWG
jgi:exodeoxyribonuclease V alpha subunit